MEEETSSQPKIKKSFSLSLLFKKKVGDQEGARPSPIRSLSESGKKFRKVLPILKLKKKQKSKPEVQVAEEEDTKKPKIEQLREKQITLLVTQTSLGYDEVKEIVSKFVDEESGACELDKAQFVKLYAALREEPLEKLNNIAKFAFNAFDSDNSGTIDLHEFISAFALTSQGNIREKLEFTFDLYDLDKSGFLDEIELKQVIEAMLLLADASVNKQASDAIAEQCLKAIDENGDGHVTKVSAAEIEEVVTL